MKTHVLPLLASVLFVLPARAQPPNGVVEGRVFSPATASFVERARVTVEGTALEAVTDEHGGYRLAAVPAGAVTLRVSYRGFADATRPLTVAPDGVAHADFEIEPATAGGIVRLAPFTVAAQQLGAQAAALNEQRTAATVKHVLAFEEFGDMGESNPGEYLKYVPGLSMTYGPNIPTFASVRGLPTETVQVTFDGAPAAMATGDRSFEFTGAATANIDRIEVNKSPTPDQPAGAIGGAINIVGKSGFSTARPKFNYSTYATFNLVSGSPGLRPRWGERPGPDSRTTAPVVNPGFDFVYLRPVSSKVALTLSGGASRRYSYYDSTQTLWNLVTNVDERYIKQDVISLSQRVAAGASLEWRPARAHRFRAGVQHSREAYSTAVNSIDFNFGAGATGDGHTVQSRTPTGIAANTASANDSDRASTSASFRYGLKAGAWAVDASLTYSYGRRVTTDIDDGTFSGFTARHTALLMRGEGIGRVHEGAVPAVAAATAAGVAVEPFDGGAMPITAVAANAGLKNFAETAGATLGVTRTLGWRLPLDLKFGGAIQRDSLDGNRSGKTWTFAAPAGAGSNTARRLGVLASPFSENTDWRDSAGRRVPVGFISGEKLYAYFLANPQFFTPNPSAEFITRVNNSRYIEETVSAGYASLDGRALENRLRFVVGARYERTHDDSVGPRNDVSAIYARDAAGRIVRAANGTPVRVTTDALQLARLQYTLRGTRSERTYGDLYPSLNASWEFRPGWIARAAAARTLARPPIREITPGVVLPDLTSAARTITLNNTELAPWTARNFDLALEAYQLRGATVSVGVFRKDIRGFFVDTIVPAAPELLDDYGIGPEFAGYDIATKRNGGEASVTGLEWSWRQPLAPLAGAWAQGLHLFANGTHLRASGRRVDDFTGFSPRNLNGGVSYARGKLLAKFNISRSGRVRSLRIAPTATVPAGAYRYVAPQTIVDASAEYRFRRALALYASARNAGESVKFTQDYAPTTPDYARTRVSQRFGAMLTFGVRGEF